MRPLKVWQVIEILKADGWYLDRTESSHRQFKHAIKLGVVTVPGKLSKELKIGTQLSILRMAGLR